MDFGLYRSSNTLTGDSDTDILSDCPNVLHTLQSKRLYTHHQTVRHLSTALVFLAESALQQKDPNYTGLYTLGTLVTVFTVRAGEHNFNVIIRITI